MYKDLFQLKSEYFNAAYMGPTPLRTQAAVQTFLERSLDPSQLVAPFELDDEVRLGFSRLLGTAPENIALSTSVSELVSHIANGLELTSKDEIVLLKDDFPSMVLPWMVGAELKGYSLRFLELDDFLEPERFKKQLRPNTRFAACSHVLFNSGTKLPVAELGKVARQAGVLFLADTSQSLGGMALEPEILANVDILVGVAYKWLLGPYGSAYGYFSPDAQKRVKRTHASWLTMPAAKSRENLLNYKTECLPGARKFDRGETSSPLICTALKASLELLNEIGLEKIGRHNQALTKAFLEKCPSTFKVIGQPDRLSNIVCLKYPDVTDLAQRLAEMDIQVSVREGSLRFSFHLYNDLQQIERLVRALN